MAIRNRLKTTLRLFAKYSLSVDKMPGLERDTAASGRASRVVGKEGDTSANELGWLSL